jgi:hypothetical protein
MKFTIALFFHNKTIFEGYDGKLGESQTGILNQDCFCNGKSFVVIFQKNANFC